MPTGTAITGNTSNPLGQGTVAQANLAPSTTPVMPAATPQPTTTPAPAPAPSSTVDASAVQQQQANPSSIQFPQNKPSSSQTASTAQTTNASVPSPIPSAESIINQGNTPTPAEQTNQSLLSQLASFMQGNQSLATEQTQAEAQAGVPAMTKTLNDLNTQLQGLTDQATALQNESQNLIPQQMVNNVQGGQYVIDAHTQSEAALRQNAIKQAQIASQSLTLKSAVYAAQGNLTLAKDAADKAGQVQFDAEQQQIDYMNSLINANKDQMTKEEKNQADLVTAQLADRQQQIDYQKQDITTGAGLIATAMKFSQSNPQALYAATQALQLDKSDPQYLQKVSQLVGQYLQDPVATQTAIANLQKARADAQYAGPQAAQNLTNAQLTGEKTALDIKTAQQNLQLNSPVSSESVTGPGGQSVQVPASVAPYASITGSGTPYVDASTLQGTATEKNAIVNAAQAAGMKVITNKNTALDLSNIQNAYSNLDTISSLFSTIGQPNAAARALGGAGLSGVASFLETDQQKAAASSMNDSALDLLKAISGVQGFRGNQGAIDQIKNAMPNIYDTQAVAAQKVANVKQLIQNRENAILGQPATPTAISQGNAQSTTSKEGDTHIYNGTTYKLSGGKWTPQ